MRVFSFEKSPRVELRVTFKSRSFRVHLPYEDTMVVTLRIANFDIKKILLDNESSVNIIFFSTLKKMEFDLRRIEPTKTNLTGLSGEVKVLKGRVVLPITVGDESNHITTLDEFHVVDSFLP